MRISVATSPALDIRFPIRESSDVRVISRRAIREFAENHSGALEPLRHWANAAEAMDWLTPADVRRTFNSVDFVGDLTVFDIGGNKYRLIAFVHYRRKAVYIKQIPTHKEYAKGGWKK